MADRKSEYGETNLEDDAEYGTEPNAEQVIAPSNKGLIGKKMKKVGDMPPVGPGVTVTTQDIQ